MVVWAALIYLLDCPIWEYMNSALGTNLVHHCGQHCRYDNRLAFLIKWGLGVERVWKIKYWSGIGYLKKFKYGSSRVRVHVKLYQKTLALQAKWSIDTKVWNMCLRQRQIFHGHRIFQHFYHVTSFKSINIVFETGKYHSWPNTLPFRVGYWGANNRTPGSDPSTCSSHNTSCELVRHKLTSFVASLNENKKSAILNQMCYIYNILDIVQSYWKPLMILCLAKEVHWGFNVF